MELEKRVKTESLKHKSITTKAKGKLQENNKKEETINTGFVTEKPDENQCTNKQSLNMRTKTGDYDDLSEEEENWDTVGMYQAYIAKQEKILED